MAANPEPGENSGQLGRPIALAEHASTGNCAGLSQAFK
jgi:hypothetical protein